MLRRNILLMSGIAATTSLSTLLAVCGSGNDKPDDDIFEVVRKDANLSVLGDAIVSADYLL